MAREWGSWWLGLLHEKSMKVRENKCFPHYWECISRCLWWILQWFDHWNLYQGQTGLSALKSPSIKNGERSCIIRLLRVYCWRVSFGDKKIEQTVINSLMQICILQPGCLYLKEYDYVENHLKQGEQYYQRLSWKKNNLFCSHVLRLSLFLKCISCIAKQIGRGSEINSFTSYHLPIKPWQF